MKLYSIPWPVYTLSPRQLSSAGDHNEVMDRYKSFIAIRKKNIYIYLKETVIHGFRVRKQMYFSFSILYFKHYLKFSSCTCIHFYLKEYVNYQKIKTTGLCVFKINSLTRTWKAFIWPLVLI